MDGEKVMASSSGSNSNFSPPGANQATDGKARDVKIFLNESDEDLR